MSVVRSYSYDSRSFQGLFGVVVKFIRKKIYPNTVVASSCVCTVKIATSRHKNINTCLSVDFILVEIYLRKHFIHVKSRKKVIFIILIESVKIEFINTK